MSVKDYQKEIEYENYKKVIKLEILQKILDILKDF